MDIAAILINCPSPEAADAIGAALLDRRLVACTNRYPSIASRYFWKGRVEEASETPLVVKTRAALFERVVAAVTEAHGYETPAIVMLPVLRASDDYAAWVIAETVEP